jgi:hypothetical protein
MENIEKSERSLLEIMDTTLRGSLLVLRSEIFSPQQLTVQTATRLLSDR